MATRGHSDIMYLEMVAMGIGILLFLTGDTIAGIVVFGLGAAVHFGLGGFETGF